MYQLFRARNTSFTSASLQEENEMIPYEFKKILKNLSFPTTLMLFPFEHGQICPYAVTFTIDIDTKFRPCRTTAKIKDNKVLSTESIM